MLSLISLLGIAVALAMDAFAVSISYGCGLRQFSTKVMFFVSSAFALFQGGMTLIGYLAGSSFAPLISVVDHYVAFGLLLFVGIKMMYEAFKNKGQCERVDPAAINLRRLLLLSLATSIDAFAVGLSFAFLKVQILFASLIIALVTLFFSMIGVKTGQLLQKYFGKKIEILGALILIFIGFHILISHFSA